MIKKILIFHPVLINLSQAHVLPYFSPHAPPHWWSNACCLLFLLQQPRQMVCAMGTPWPGGGRRALPLLTALLSRLTLIELLCSSRSSFLWQLSSPYLTSFHFDCLHTLFYVYITIISQVSELNITQEEWNYKLQLRQSDSPLVWPHSYPPPHAWLSTPTLVFKQPLLLSTYLTSRKITWDRGEGNSFNSEFHWLW